MTVAHDSFTNTSEHRLDAYGRRTALICGAMTNTYSFGDDGRLVGIAISGQGMVTYEYDTLGRPVGIRLPGGSVRTLAHDGFGSLVTNRVADSAGNNVLLEAFEHNLMGNVVSKHTEPAVWAYSYDAADQLTLTVSTDTTTSAASTNLYAYDPMGNRVQMTAAGGLTTAYAANSLNQYCEVSNQQSHAALTYDVNGNLTNDGVRVYSWDIENRLIAVEPLSPTNGAKKVEMAYDFLSRRIRKVASEWGGNQWEVVGANTFVYDGWNVIYEISDTPTPPYSVTNSYTWGLDLSGSFQGAGGIGGLLAATFGGSNSVFYCYDHNGNVERLITASGATVATYEYSPFGELTRQSGSAANQNPFRFSTKYTDDETGLVYYGYRYYSPELGRWLSRDSIGELAGVNLYAFLFNNGLSDIDYLGRESRLKKIGRAVGGAVGKITGPPRRITGGLIGELTSVATLEKFQSRGRSPVDPTQKHQCSFLLTLAGMGNNFEDNMDFGRQVLKAVPGLAPHIGSDSHWGFANNPVPSYVGLPLSILKAGADELHAPRRPVWTAVRYIQEAYATGQRNKCCCIDMFVVAHSQGGQVLANALQHLSPEIKKTLRILTLNSQQPIPKSPQFGSVDNLVEEGWDIAFSLGKLAPDRWFTGGDVEVKRILGVKSHKRAAFYDHLSGVPANFVPVGRKCE